MMRCKALILTLTLSLAATAALAEERVLNATLDVPILDPISASFTYSQLQAGAEVLLPPSTIDNIEMELLSLGIDKLGITLLWDLIKPELDDYKGVIHSANTTVVVRKGGDDLHVRSTRSEDPLSSEIRAALPLFSMIDAALANPLEFLDVSAAVDELAQSNNLVTVEDTTGDLTFSIEVFNTTER